ncbi:aromatic acid exporter family protein [Micromonospora krabiensis]|uniref:Fusaric acid resistance protein-like n=1 Tax=Micromonospora krabiensis TaxID=307121 RepID=A0A1C3MZT9_9ACTN|nr:FUSC family protein [Micromonospora krabiensis]SBV25857.1 Fusaric acid resistance protein-like [Micromonospora krabiensis]
MVQWSWPRVAAGRLRRGWQPVLEATLAATVTWVLAARVLGHPQPFFAPAAALIVLGQARGQRLRRAVEVVLGVAGGVLVADLVIQALGPGTTWTVFTVILLTVTLAAAIGATGVTLVQAAVSALYLVVVAPSTESLVPFRFVDALIGGAVALAVSQLVDARRPLAPLVAEVRATFEEMAALLAGVADALDRHDEAAALAALERARAMDARVSRLRDGVLAAGEALWLNLRRRRHMGRLRSVDTSILQIDYAVRNVRVLARAGVTLSRVPAPAPPDLGVALRSLAEAVRAAGEALAADLEGRDETADGHAARADEAALAAVHTAGQLFTPGQSLPLVMIIGQVRATAIDLLRGVGADDDATVLGRVDHSLGLPPV